MAAVYRIFNGPMCTTAAQASVATGTTIKTHLQVATSATSQGLVIAWGWSLSVAPGAPGIIELLQTDVAATVTAHAASGVQPMNAGDPPASPSLTLGTAATGYTASAEGSITATKQFDVCQLPVASGATDLNYKWVFPAASRPVLPVSRFLRVRATTPTTGGNFICWADVLV